MPLVSATVVKEQTDSKLGIAFERESETTAMRIKLIRDDSLFATSELAAGMVVVSAAGEDMEGKTPKDAADALRSAPGGEEISLVCKGAVITVKKDKPKRFKKAPKLGISFKSTTAQPGKVFVSNIKEDSKFNGTDLVVGHQVLTINGLPCPHKVSDAVELLKTRDEITLVTHNPEDEAYTPPPKEEEEEEEAPAEESAPAEVVEEKKEEVPAEEGTEKAEEEDLTPEGNKNLLDTVFGVCMC